MESLSHKALLAKLKVLEKEDHELADLLVPTVTKDDFINIMMSRGIPRNMAALAMEYPFVLEFTTRMTVFYMGNIFEFVFDQEQKYRPQHQHQEEQAREALFLKKVTIVTKFCEFSIKLDKNDVYRHDNNIVFASDYGTITIPIKAYRYLEKRRDELWATNDERDDD